MPKVHSKKLKPVVVVQGYHFGSIKDHKGFRHFISMNQQYAFRIDRHTKHSYRAKPGRCCKVYTKYGLKNLVITKIFKPTGSIAVKFARKLKPVQYFSLFGMRDKYMYKILKNKTGLDLKPKFHGKAARRKIYLDDKKKRTEYYKKMVKNHQHHSKDHHIHAKSK